MTLTEALFLRLTTHAGLSALISTRAYPLRLPQNVTLPAVACQLVSKQPAQQLQGAAGLYVARIQVTAFGSSYDSARDTAEQVLAALHDFSGLLGGAGGVQCDITLANEVEMVDAVAEATTYRVIGDYEIWYQA